MQQEPVVEKVNSFLSQNNLNRKSFVLGFSGGYDSMCLLKVLSFLGIKVVAAHFNHGWRVEADLEEQVCREFCESLGIEFYSERAPKELKKTESAAREARYQFLEKVLKQHSFDGIITAHNADDNAETVIYRVAKGTGVYGLRGISVNRNNIWRPLLSCSRKEIEEYCIKNALVPNTDSSNFDTKYRRNFIRHEILPRLEEINPDAKNAINSLSELADLEERVVDEYLSLIGLEIVENSSISTHKFLKLSDAVKQRFLYSFLKDYLLEYSSKKVFEILEFIIKNSSKKTATKMSLTTGKWLSVNQEKIYVYIDEEEKSEILLISEVGEYSYNNQILEIKECSEIPSKYPVDKLGIAYVDLTKISFPFELRYGIPSKDKIKPFGMSGEMLLKKYLSGKSVPQHLRKRLPVLVKDNSILWVPKFGISEDISVKQYPTHILVWK